jgi:HPt (histidine-containing phosphotransfer) domain-containing protein
VKFRDHQALEFLRQFRAAREAGDWASATRYAHTLKSTARTLGAAELGDCAVRLEEATGLVDLEAITASQAAMELEFDRVLRGLSRLEAPRTSSTRPGSTPHALMQLLTRQLEEHDTAAVETVTALEQALADGIGRTEISDIKRAIARYDFAAAREHVRHLAVGENATDPVGE